MPIVRKRAFTLVEIMVAMIILVTSVAGILTAFLSAKRHILHAKRRLQAVQLGSQKLEDLYQYVRNDTWNNVTNKLYPGSYPSESITLDEINTYNRSYVVSNMAPNAYRKVTVTVQWNETATH